MTMTLAHTRPTAAVTRPALVWERACAVADLEPSWGEAALSLDGAWTNLLTGQTAAGRVRLADVFATLPVALLVQG